MENPSLRLVKILQEEFDQLHGYSSSAAPVSSSDEQKGPTIKTTAQLKESLNPREDQKLIRDTPFKAFRLKKLNEWLDPDASLDSLSPILDNHSITLEKILLEKINDVWLVFQEEWVQDAPLRPFTRGLLQNYLRNYSHLKPSQTSTSHPLYKEQTKKARELNRLILEDIFPEILEREDDLELTALYKAMLEKNQKALVLSGGGIRSGTFALGIVQGLAQLGISPETFTYLSTVSGGGFLGGWLTAWIHQSGIDNVSQQLKPESAYPLEPAPIRHLRNYSNYLSPLIGLFSADTWTLVAIYLRNLIVNWLLIIPFLAAITVIPWIFVSLLHYRPEAWGVMSMVTLGMVLYLFSDFFTKKNPPILQDQYQTDKQSQVWEKSWKNRNQNQFILLCLLPALLAVFCWTLGWFWFFYGDFADTDGFILHHFYQFHEQIRTEWTRKFSFCTYLKFSGITVSFVLIEWIVFFLMEKIGWIPERFHTKKIERLYEFIGLLLAGVLAGVLLINVAHVMPHCLNDRVPIFYTCLALPTLLCLLLLNTFIYEGIKSKIVEDAEREWMSRYSSWFLLISMVWLVSTGFILYGPLLAEAFFNYVFTIGAVTSYLTAYLGQKLRSNGKPETSDGKRQSPLGYVSLPLLAFVALAILLIALSFMNIALIGKALDFVQDTGEKLKANEIYDLPLGYPFLILIIMGSLCGIFSYLIKTNDFSLHALYRNRLIRAYLGASRPEGVRRADPFTGFDESDNIYMRDLVKKEAPVVVPKPFLLINIALNLVSGKNLAWEERKAASFTVSALHAGSQFIGYRKTYQNPSTEEEKVSHYGGKRGISLGTAMTISGAAVSPNMGYHTSPLVAFFMTLFNLRLGWWLGNPGPAGDDTFSLGSPRWGLKPILSEMFGQTDELNNYVYLSDGGHFDNLGLYEMTLRRNRFIIVSDGSCDENCELEDLGNAIRKIRIDQGITIDFPLGFDLYARKETNRKDGKYWAIGRIRYPEHSNNQSNTDHFGPTDGILLYIKPGIYGNEPKDIFNYASSNKTFPHESTSDQFFSESQFESYRALGVHALIQTSQQLKNLYDLTLPQMLEAVNNPGKWKSKVIDKLNLESRKMNLKPRRPGPNCFFGQKKNS